MANEFKHKTVGSELTQTEYESIGGHVLDSQATGDIIYASSTSQLRRLAIGSTGAVLTVTGGVPAWDTTWTPTGDLIPSADDSYDLGSAAAAWQDLFLEGDITLTDAGTLATSAGALTVNGAGGLNLQEGGSTIIGISDSRALSTTNTASVDLDATGAIQINSSGGALSIGNDNVDQTINIATAGTRTLNIGIGDGTDITTTVVKGTLSVGVDDAGYDVKFFGASAGAYMLYDESEDQLVVMGKSADATDSTGKLLLATSLTDVNANDVIGKVDFQAPLEAGGTDAITIAASIQAIAQGTFAADLNATDLVFYTGHSEAATEKFRFTSQGELGVGGANYGSSGQVLTSGGTGAAPTWETPTTGDITGITTGDGLSGGVTSGTATLAVDLVSNGGLEFSSGELRVATGISQYDVAQFAASVADDDFLRIDGTAVEGLSASEVAAAIEANIDAVGTIASGIWQGTAIASGYMAQGTTSAKGALEIATTAEINTSTDADRAMTPDLFAASNYGIRYVQIMAVAADTDLTVADGLAYFHVPAGLNGMDLVEVHAEVFTAPVGSTATFEISLNGASTQMLSTNITIDASETGSDTAATAAVINTSTDDVNTNDLIQINCTQIGSSTAGKGLLVTMGFRIP